MLMSHYSQNWFSYRGMFCLAKTTTKKTAFPPYEEGLERSAVVSAFIILTHGGIRCTLNRLVFG